MMKTGKEKKNTKLKREKHINWLTKALLLFINANAQIVK